MVSADFINRISPLEKTSKRRIIYKKSSWKLHKFEIWSGELVCRAEVLRLDGSSLLWLGGGSGQPELGEVALGLPCETTTEGAKCGALATTLIGMEGHTSAMARRLAAALGRPVYVCCSCALDRLSAPLIESGLKLEMQSKPECF